MNQPTKQKRKGILWLTFIGVLLTGVGVLATLATDKELRCRLLGVSWSCPPPFKTVELIMQDESGQHLAGVEVIARGLKGAPVKSYTDVNGYVKINIESIGDVGLTLSKSGYAVQNLSLNLEAQQDTVMVFKFSDSGNPAVNLFSNIEKIPPPIARSYIPDKPVPVTAIKTEFVSMELTGVSKDSSGDVNMAFVISNLTKENLYLGINWGNGGTITDNYGQICNRVSLNGLATVNANDTTPGKYTLISPSSTITVATECNFPNSSTFNASFPLIRFQLSDINPDGQLTHFNAGFRGIKLSQKQ
jgi:hypothetical protein